MAESAEGARLLSEYTGKPVSRVRIPLSPPLISSFGGIMKHRVVLLFVVVVIVVAGCAKEKEEQKQIQAQSSHRVARKETKVVVPPFVEGRWKAVKIKVIDKPTLKEKVYTVGIGDKVVVPEAEISLKIIHFLPEFVMAGAILTSQTNELKNPAVQIVIAEGGKDIFKGWLFAKFPTTHAFQHPRYGFALVDFVPAR